MAEVILRNVVAAELQDMANEVLDEFANCQSDEA